MGHHGNQLASNWAVHGSVVRLVSVQAFASFSFFSRLARHKWGISTPCVIRAHPQLKNAAPTRCMLPSRLRHQICADLQLDKGHWVFVEHARCPAARFVPLHWMPPHLHGSTFSISQPLTRHISAVHYAQLYASIWQYRGRRSRHVAPLFVVSSRGSMKGQFRARPSRRTADRSFDGNLEVWNDMYIGLAGGFLWEPPPHNNACDAIPRRSLSLCK